MVVKKITTSLTLAAAMAVSGATFADTNRALEAWKEFAAEQNNPNYDKWVSLISQPAAIEKAKKWKELRGYDAYDIIDKTELPAELKPGLIITKDNKADYPWLKDYLPKELYDAVGSSWGAIGKITIVPTNTYYMHDGYYKGTKEIIDKNIKIIPNEKGELVYEDGRFALLEGPATTAIPFVHPKNGIELNWDYVAHSTNSDTLSFNPLEMNACSPDGSLDRSYKADLFWWHYHNRTNVAPFGDIEDKDDFIEGGAVFFLEPNDVRGFAGVRQRYASGDREDDFKAYIPSLRRTRLLTGSDSQDPLAAGLELTWDDWRSYWVKTDVSKFEYNLVGETLILAAPEVGHAYDAHVMTEDKCNWASIEVELRPVWILEIVDKTGKYQYSKRRSYIDKEMYFAQYHMTWDPRGNPLRNWDDVRDFRPSTGDMSWSSALVSNQTTQRASTLFMDTDWEGMGENVTEEMFDVEQLRDYR
jgi:hypothetical protein